MVLPHSSSTYRLLLVLRQGESGAQGHARLRLQRAYGDGRVRAAWSADGGLKQTRPWSAVAGPVRARVWDQPCGPLSAPAPLPGLLPLSMEGFPAIQLRQDTLPASCFP